MSSPQLSLTPEFVTAYRDAMLAGLRNEMQITKRVLAAVPDGKRDYRPDPNARSAWDLATHLANVDVWFADGIADLKFGAEEEDLSRIVNPHQHGTGLLVRAGIHSRP